MMRTAVLPMLALALAGVAVPDQSTPLPVHVGGRMVEAPDGNLSFGWPGTYIEGRFRGTSVRVRFDASADHIRLSIDGVERRLFRAPGLVDTVLSGLPMGEHLVRLDKLTESQTGASRFIAFETDGTPLPPTPRPRQIEFIGDSFTVGYGNMSPTRECSGPQVHERTDTSRAFGPIAAHVLDADYRINAFSGFGVVRNYDGAAPGQNLPLLYARAIPGDAAHPASDAGWRPQTIVVNLGGNDYSTALKPGEVWADADALKAAYRRGYAAFVTMLAARQPQAHFILMGTDPFFADVSMVAAQLEAALPGRVTVLHFSGLDLGGCHGHPSLADHRLLAGLVARAIDRP